MSIKKPMNKIEKLIDELCLDGVEFRELGEVCEKTSNIKWQNNKSKQFQYIDLSSVDRNKNIITETQVITSETAPSRAQKIVRLGDVIFGTTRPTLKRFCVINHVYNEQICSTGFCVLRPKSETVLTNYIFHFISSSDFYSYTESNQKGASYPAISDNMVKKFKIPIPPLAVQEEIVKILDNFTKLEAELEAELEARKKQYEHYRKELLRFDDGVEFRELGEISINLDAQRKPVTKSLRQKGNYPYYGASGIVDYVNEYIFDGDYLLISEDGANLLARKTPIAFSVSGKSWVNNHAHILKFDDLVTQKYIEIYLNSISLNEYISGAAQPKLNQGNLNSIEIPFPIFESRKRIVAILDKFDALVNDISIGLPAEIAARKKQYEYYRNQLLTFTPLDSFASNGVNK
ncbi:MAG: restriction endonuclease subunit S [Candidatus Anammoxibacter sp.]